MKNKHKVEINKGEEPTLFGLAMAGRLDEPLCKTEECVEEQMEVLDEALERVEEVAETLDEDETTEDVPESPNKPITKTRVIPTNYYLGDRISPSRDIRFTAKMFSTYMNGAFKEQDNPVEVYVTNAEEQLEGISPTERVGYVKKFSIDSNGQVVAEIEMENEELYNRVIGRRRLVPMFDFDFQRRMGVVRDIVNMSRITFIPEIDRYYSLLKDTLDSIVVKDLRYIRNEELIAQVMKNCLEDFIQCSK